MKGYVHSIQSMGTLDGPGLRAVLFLSGCPIRCIYCHNPDTHVMTDGEYTDSDVIARKLLRLKPYIKNSGVTFSGGEPCMQSDFLIKIARELKKEGLHIALDTSGAVLNESTDKLLELTDLVLLDVKFTTEDEYIRYTGGHLSSTLDMLKRCDERKIPVWIRQVIVPGINDNKESVIALRELLRPYSVIEKIELLPFKKLCLEKYEALGKSFPLKDTPELSESALSELNEYLNK